MELKDYYTTVDGDQQAIEMKSLLKEKYPGVFINMYGITPRSGEWTKVYYYKEKNH